MNDEMFIAFIVVPAVLIGVYVIVRIAALAWFQGKRSHTQQVIRQLDEERKS